MGNQTIKLSPVYNEHKATTVLRQALSGMSTRDVRIVEQEADVLPQECNTAKEPWTNWGRQLWLAQFDANIKAATVTVEKDASRPIGFTHICWGGCYPESHYQGVRIPTHLVPRLADDFKLALGVE